MNLNRVIARRLRLEGYEVDAHPNGAAAFDAAKRGGYDAMVLDVMMPGMDGLAFVRALRAAGDDTPLLFLTARDAVEDRVAGLDAGADRAVYLELRIYGQFQYCGCVYPQPAPQGGRRL